MIALRRLFLLLIIIESKLTANDVVLCDKCLCNFFPAADDFAFWNTNCRAKKLEQMRIHCTIPRLIMTRQ